MSMSDPVADLLTRVRNAIQARHSSVDIPASQLKIEICRVLKEEGFVRDYSVDETTKPGLVRLQLKYDPVHGPVVQGLRRVSKPSLRVYSGSRDINRIRGGLGISILSTSSGVMTGRQAAKDKIGGEVLCEVW